MGPVVLNQRSHAVFGEKALIGVQNSVSTFVPPFRKGIEALRKLRALFAAEVEARRPLDLPLIRLKL
jgi:hypothetical protein